MQKIFVIVLHFLLFLAAKTDRVLPQTLWLGPGSSQPPALLRRFIKESQGSFPPFWVKAFFLFLPKPGSKLLQAEGFPPAGEPQPGNSPVSAPDSCHSCAKESPLAAKVPLSLEARPKRKGNSPGTPAPKTPNPPKPSAAAPAPRRLFGGTFPDSFAPSVPPGLRPGPKRRPPKAGPPGAGPLKGAHPGSKDSPAGCLPWHRIW